MAAELAKVCRICCYADGVCTIGFRKTHERADPMCRLHGSTSRGTVPPARAKASARPGQEPPLGEQEGEEEHQPKPVGEGLETAGHDQMTQFVTRKKTAYAVPAGPAGQMDSPGHSDDESRGRLRGQQHGGSTKHRRYRRRFHKRCKLGGKADRLVRIVDRYMPRIIVGAVVGLAEPTCNRTPDGKQYEEFSST